jgi:hypothetical protein
MRERFVRRTGAINWPQVATGGALLCIGASLYALARESPVWFLPPALHLSVLPAELSRLAGSLPTFTHTAALSLLTASFIGNGTWRAVAACAAWTATNILFELGQHAAARVWLVARVPRWFDHTWLLDQTRSYFLNGSFDYQDIAAAVLGGAVALVVILKTRHRGEQS